MDALSQSIIPPNSSYLELLRYLLVMTLLIYVPYISMVVGCTVLSVLFNWRDQDVRNNNFGRLSKELMDLVLPNKVVPFVMGVLPLVAIWFIYIQSLFQAETHAVIWLYIVGAALAALSFGPLLTYRGTLYPDGGNTKINLLIGTAGIKTLLLGVLLVTAAIVRFNDPERWHLAHNPFRLLLSFNVIWKYTLFLVGSVGLSGVGILFFFFHWRRRESLSDEGYARFVKNFAAGVALPCLLLLPVVGFFYTVTTPTVGMSGPVFWIAAAISIILFLIFVDLYRTILDDRVRFGTRAFVLFIGVFLLVAVSDQLTFVNATAEHRNMLISKADERAAKIAMEREAERGVGQVVDVAVGKKVFDEVCSVCHQMDKRLVGPPLAEVLPNYSGKLDELVAFIQSPSKKNPDYPPMPPPPSSLIEIKSVATYLLEQIGAPTGSSGEADSGGH